MGIEIYHVQGVDCGAAARHPGAMRSLPARICIMVNYLYELDKIERYHEA